MGSVRTLPIWKYDEEIYLGTSGCGGVAMHAMSFLDELSSLMFLLAGLAQPNKKMPQSLMPRYCPAGTNTFQYFTCSVFRSTLSRRMVQSARWVGSWQIWQVVMWWCLKNRWIEIAFTKICNASKLWWPYQAVNFNDNTAEVLRSHEISSVFRRSKGAFCDGSAA